MKDGTTLTIDETIMDTNEAIDTGGIMYYTQVQGRLGYTNTITITNSLFNQQTAENAAGGFYIDNPYITAFTITSTTFTNSYALNGNGGIFAIVNFNGMMTVTSCTFQTLSAIYNVALNQEYQGSLLYSTASNYGLTISSSTINCVSSFNNATV